MICRFRLTLGLLTLGKTTRLPQLGFFLLRRRDPPCDPSQLPSVNGEAIGLPVGLVARFLLRHAMSDDYDDGRRDTDIASLKDQARAMWTKLEAMQGWQNRAIGYVTAIATVLTLLVQYVFKKIGA